MAHEFKHDTVGIELTQDEFEDVGLHVFDSQAEGDLLYASSETQLSGFPIGVDGDRLFIGNDGGLKWRH
jgi:hypothetical protein